MRKKLVMCGAMTTFAVVVVYILYALSQIPANRSNHFARKFRANVLTNIGELQWQSRVWHMAGVSDSAFYLGNRDYLNIVMRVGSFKLDTSTYYLTITGTKNPMFDASSWVIIDSNAFYLADGKNGKLCRGDLLKWKAKIMDTGLLFFDKALVLGSNLFFRNIEPGNGFALGKRNEITRSQKIFPGLLEKQVDGFFDKDGSLLKDKRHSYVVYIYRYRNQFVVMDTSMNISYKGKTIDTMAHIPLQLGRTERGQMVKMATPPPIVNQYACIDNGYLYVKSALKADNEPLEVFRNASVVDIYDLRNGDYAYSFYVSDHNHEKMREFMVSGDRLAALYPHYLRMFRFTHPPTNQVSAPLSSSQIRRDANPRSSSDHR